MHLHRITHSSLVATMLAVLALSAQSAFAHAKLVSADPAPEATVPDAAAIRLQFSEGLAKKFCSLRLTDAHGKPVSLTPAEAGDAKALAAVPAKALAPGQYTVSWTAVASDDGHRTTGRYHFTVQ